MCLRITKREIKKERILNSKGIPFIKTHPRKNITEVIIEARPTILDIRKTSTQLLILSKSGTLKKGRNILKLAIAPKLVETPLPPLNLRKIGQLCPHTAKRDVAIEEIFIKLFLDSKIKKTRHTGRKPFKKSKRNTNIPHPRPITLATLVAPIFPEPKSLISRPFTFLARIKPKGIEPRI